MGSAVSFIKQQKDVRFSLSLMLFCQITLVFGLSSKGRRHDGREEGWDAFGPLTPSPANFYIHITFHGWSVGHEHAVDVNKSFQLEALRIIGLYSKICTAFMSLQNLYE